MCNNSITQNVIRNWYARDEEVMRIIDDLVCLAHLSRTSFEQGNINNVSLVILLPEALERQMCFEFLTLFPLYSGDLVQLGHCITRYWLLKKTLAPGSEPRAVTQIMESLRDRCHGICMAGAGGGGFMYVLTKEKKDEENIRRILNELKV